MSNQPITKTHITKLKKILGQEYKIIKILAILIISYLIIYPLPKFIRSSRQEENQIILNKTYTNLQGEYSLKYPSTWSVEETPTPNPASLNSVLAWIKLLPSNATAVSALLEIRYYEPDFCDHLRHGNKLNSMKQSRVMIDNYMGTAFDSTNLTTNIYYKLIQIPYKNRCYEFDIEFYKTTEQTNTFNKILENFQFTQ